MILHMEEENKKNVTIETYADDMAKVVGSNEGGIIKKIIEEEEKHEAENKRVSPENRLNKIFLFIGIFFVLLSFGAVSLVYLFKKEILTVEVKPQYTPLIFIDKTQFKEISGLKKEEIAQTILNEVNTAEFKLGGIEGIYITENKKILGLRGFLSKIEANLDQEKIEFVGDNFLIGVTNDGNIPKEEEVNSLGASFGAKNLFILLKMRSIADVFEPMRLWESKMFLDLHNLFGANLNIETKYLLEKDFEDGIIQNKNARILRNKDGKIVMMYVFAEEDSLVITNSENTVAEIMLRLASSKVKK